MHTKTESIKKHLKEKHKLNKIPRRKLLDNTTVLIHSPLTRRSFEGERIPAIEIYFIITNTTTKQNRKFRSTSIIN